MKNKDKNQLEKKLAKLKKLSRKLVDAVGDLDFELSVDESVPLNLSRLASSLYIQTDANNDLLHIVGDAVSDFVKPR